MDLSELAVVDGHAHPLIPDGAAVSVDAFLALFTEGRPGAMAGHVEHTRCLQRAVRDLARRLGCDATVPAGYERFDVSSSPIPGSAIWPIRSAIERSTCRAR